MSSSRALSTLAYGVGHPYLVCYQIHDPGPIGPFAGRRFLKCCKILRKVITNGEFQAVHECTNKKEGEREKDSPSKDMKPSAFFK
jgi:hypothetical protein